MKILLYFRRGSRFLLGLIPSCFIWILIRIFFNTKFWAAYCCLILGWTAAFALFAVLTSEIFTKIVFDPMHCEQDGVRKRQQQVDVSKNTRSGSRTVSDNFEEKQHDGEKEPVKSISRTVLEKTLKLYGVQVFLFHAQINFTAYKLNEWMNLGFL